VREHHPRRRSRLEPEAGFTLPELLIAVSIMGVVIAAIAGVFVVAMRTNESIGRRHNESHDAQILATYWANDVQSTWAIAGNAFPCGTLGAGQSIVANFALNNSGEKVTYLKSGGSLLRRQCDQSTGTVGDDLTVVRLADPALAPSVTCDGATCDQGERPNSVKISVTEEAGEASADAYKFELTGSRRQGLGGGGPSSPPPIDVALFALGNGSGQLCLDGQARLEVKGDIYVNYEAAAAQANGGCPGNNDPTATVLLQGTNNAECDVAAPSGGNGGGGNGGGNGGGGNGGGGNGGGNGGGGNGGGGGSTPVGENTGRGLYIEPTGSWDFEIQAPGRCMNGIVPETLSKDSVPGSGRPDPFVGRLPLPDHSTYPPGVKVGNVWQPGVYTNRLTVSGNESMAPGEYILERGLSISSSFDLTGTTGTFIFSGCGLHASATCGTGPNRDVSVSGSGIVTAAPPSSGPYQGVLYWQHKDNKEPVTVSGSSQLLAPTAIFYAPGSIQGLVVGAGSPRVELKSLLGTNMRMMGSAVARVGW